MTIQSFIKSLSLSTHFYILRATPVAYGDFQARSHQSCSHRPTLQQQQRWIFNPVSKARDRISVHMDASQIVNHWATRGTPTRLFDSLRDEMGSTRVTAPFTWKKHVSCLQQSHRLTCELLLLSSNTVFTWKNNCQTMDRSYQSEWSKPATSRKTDNNDNSWAFQRDSEVWKTHICHHKLASIFLKTFLMRLVVLLTSDF